jgi:hypothetical protein
MSEWWYYCKEEEILVYKVWLVKRALAGPFLPELVSLILPPVFEPFHIRIPLVDCVVYSLYRNSLRDVAARMESPCMHFLFGKAFSLERSTFGGLSLSYSVHGLRVTKSVPLEQQFWTLWHYFVNLARDQRLKLPLTTLW